MFLFLFINIKVKFKLDTKNNVRYLFHEIPLKLEYVISQMNYIMKYIFLLKHKTPKRISIV